MAGPEIASAALRLTTYLSVFLLVGATGLGLRLRGAPDGVTEPMRNRLRRSILAASAVLTMASLGGLYGQTWLFFGADEGVNPETLRIIAMETRWGAGWRVQFGAASFAFIGALLLHTRARSTAWPVLAVGATIAASAQALTGHAAESSWLTTKVAAQAVHVTGGSLWIGSLLAIGAIALRPDTDRALATRIIERFSPLALVSVGLLTLSGAVSAYYYLMSPIDLFLTVYGRVLGTKLLCFGLAAAIGYHNWQSIRPRLPAAGALADLRRSVTAELGLALIILVLTAFLVSLPLPAWGM